MLALKPPVPTGDIEFERVFRPHGPDGIDQLTRLSAARRALTTALLPLILTADDASKEELLRATQTADAYQARWIAFWKQRIVHGPGDATRVPVVFRWRVDVFHDDTDASNRQTGSVEYVDPSPLTETVCAVLAAAVCKQRAGAANVGGGASALAYLQGAVNDTEWIRTKALPLFRPWVQPRTDDGGQDATSIRRRALRRREPHFFADAFHEAIVLGVTGHMFCKQALLESVRGETAVQTSVRLFRGAQRFQQASVLLPAEPLLRSSHHRAAASAYRYLAEALANQDTRYMGVAVACAQEAVQLSSAKHKEFMEELQRRNEAEAGYQTVPSRSAIKLEFLAKATELYIADTTTAIIRIVIPIKLAAE